MTASTVKSVNITNFESDPITVGHRQRGILKSTFDSDTVAITSVDETGDITLIGKIRSNASLVDVLVKCGKLDSHACPTLTLNVGFYYSGVGGNQALNGLTSGTVIDADAIATASTFAQADVNTWTSVYNKGAGNTTKEVWELCSGLTEDPGGWFYIGLTVVTAAATDASDVVDIRIDYLD